MRHCIRYMAIGIALAAGTSLAQAQTFVDRPVEEAIVAPPATVIVPPQPFAAPTPALVVTDAAPPVAAAPAQTVDTMPAERSVTRRVVRTRNGDRVTITTIRTVVRRGVASAPAPTPAVQAITQPTYGEVVSPYTRLYDVVTPAAVASPVVAEQPVAGVPIGPPILAYRYVYEPDRILVIDVNTGIAVQAIPR